MLWSMDTCQNKVSADQYHVTISRAQARPYRGQLFLSSQVRHSHLNINKASFFALFLWLDVATRLCYVNKRSWQPMLFIFRYGSENICFLHFLLVLIRVWHNIAVLRTHWWLRSYSSQALEGYVFASLINIFFLRTVPTIVIAHTFCASRDTRISYQWCLLIQGYFCVV